MPMDGLRAVNVYVLETEQGLVLIDGGWAIEESRRQLESSLASIGRVSSTARCPRWTPSEERRQTAR